MSAARVIARQQLFDLVVAHADPEFRRTLEQEPMAQSSGEVRVGRVQSSELADIYSRRQRHTDGMDEVETIGLADFVSAMRAEQGFVGLASVHVLRWNIIVALGDDDDRLLGFTAVRMRRKIGSLDAEEIATLRRLLAAIGRLQWTPIVEDRDQTSGDSFIMVGGDGEPRGEDIYVSSGSRTADADLLDFIAAARNALPRLLDQVGEE